MLAADKLLLRSTVKQRAIQLREKELTLFNENFNAVGTQSAVLAGFAMTSFAEIDLPHNAFYAQKAFLHIFVVTSVCANLLCTACTTFVSVWGSGKALRGKDGSMDQAVDGMHDERTFIFSCFGVGLISTLLALMSAAWILMTLEVAAVATLLSWSTLEVNSYLATFAPGLRAGGVSITWARFALAFLITGIRYRLTALRYCGLALFGIVAVKVFTSDLDSLDSFYRIVAFLILGVLLLLGSFLYLRFRETFSVEPPPVTGDGPDQATEDRHTMENDT